MISKDEDNDESSLKESQQKTKISHRIEAES